MDILKHLLELKSDINQSSYNKIGFEANIYTENVLESQVGTIVMNEVGREIMYELERAINERIE